MQRAVQTAGHNEASVWSINKSGKTWTRAGGGARGEAGRFEVQFEVKFRVHHPRSASKA